MNVVNPASKFSNSTPAGCAFPSAELNAFRILAKQIHAAREVEGQQMVSGTPGEAEASALVVALCASIRDVERAIFAKPVGTLEAVRERFEVLQFWLVPIENFDLATPLLESDSDDGITRAAANLYPALAELFESDASEE
jgi:hypothetical protein